jgi:hypothetical protein
MKADAPLSRLGCRRSTTIMHGPKTQISSLWSFRTTLMTAGIAIEDLRPKYMRGYGDLPEEAVRDLEALASQVTDVLDRMSDSAGRKITTSATILPCGALFRTACQALLNSGSISTAP